MITFQNAQVWFEGKLQAVNVIIDNNLIIQVSPTVVKGRVINLSSDHLILPGFIDVHTHLRTPAPRDYPTSMKSETRAALYGGYQMVCAMPNTVPPIDDNQKLWRQQKAARAQAYLPVYEYAAATVKQAGQQLVNFTGLKPYVFGFSDDGKGFDNHKLFSEFANQLNGTKLVFSVHLQNMAKTQGKTVVDHEKAQVFNQSGFVNADESDQLQ